MVGISIDYFSGYGHTQKHAEALIKGASSIQGGHHLFKINELGESSPEQGPLPGDLATAISYGKRISELANKINL